MIENSDMLIREVLVRNVSRRTLIENIYNHMKREDEKYTLCVFSLNIIKTKNLNKRR
jgi:hypothetical protein